MYRGARPTMEDTYTIFPGPELTFFAVYDGHTGIAAAKYASEHLHARISHNYCKSTDMMDAILTSFAEIDREMIEDRRVVKQVYNCFMDTTRLTSGTTALLLVKLTCDPNALYIANLGDSRAVALYENGRVEQITVDHKVQGNKIEMKRLVAAGAEIEDDRINGLLAVSRALGDYTYKNLGHYFKNKNLVLSQPDVFVRPITAQLQFLVLATDGLWDTMSNRSVMRFISQLLNEGVALQTVSGELEGK